MATVLEPSIDRGPAPESSDRSFGFVFAAVFAIMGFWPLMHWLTPRWWASPSRRPLRSPRSRGRKSCILSTGSGSRSAACCTRS